mmetsp:Transcript_118437/g.281160  ORF Transcript_118437/g.281160 Transcript_118437/m.281160 type:complete len:328 (-) Transcript_118437:26-1009(-)
MFSAVWKPLFLICAQACWACWVNCPGSFCANSRSFSSVTLKTSSKSWVKTSTWCVARVRVLFNFSTAQEAVSSETDLASLATVKVDSDAVSRLFSSDTMVPFTLMATSVCPTVDSVPTTMFCTWTTCIFESLQSARALSITEATFFLTIMTSSMIEAFALFTNFVSASSASASNLVTALSNSSIARSVCCTIVSSTDFCTSPVLFSALCKIPPKVSQIPLSTSPSWNKRKVSPSWNKLRVSPAGSTEGVLTPVCKRLIFSKSCSSSLLCEERSYSAHDSCACAEHSAAAVRRSKAEQRASRCIIRILRCSPDMKLALGYAKEMDFLP